MPADERTPLLRDVEQLAGQVKPDLLHIAKVIGALQAGKLPTQAQVNQAIEALTSTRSSFISPDRRRGEGKLSEGGRLILQDTRDILLKLQKWLDAKNKGDVIQELLYNTTKASLDVDADANIDIKKPASSKEVKKDANDLSETLRTLVSLVLDQAKILKRDATKEGSGILGDLILLSRDLLADAAEEVSALAEEAAKEIRPSEGEEGKLPSKEDIKQKGKQAQDKAKSKASEAQSRLEKEASPAQDKAIEAKDKAVDRLVSVAQRIQKDPAYKKAFDQLYGLARKYYKKTGKAIEATAESASVDGDVYGNEHTQRALKAFKQLLENLADGKSVDPVIEKANKVFEDIKADERLSKLLDDVELYLKTLLEDPDYAASKAPKRDAGKLYDRGQELLQSNAEWKEDANTLLQELEAFGKAIADDKQGKAVADAVAKLGTDLAGTAKVGARMFKGKAGAFYRDIVNVLVPRALALLREIPIPRTEYKSRDIEFVIDNFTITSASFVPDNLIITNHSEFAARDIGKAHGGANVESSTRVRFDGLRFTAKDVSFWVRRPGAILLSEERGLLDLALTGAGLSGDLTLALSDEDDEESYFKVTKSSVSLKNLSLSIHDNYHYILSFIFGPILNAAVKVSLEHALSAQISDSFEMLDWRAFDIRRRALRYQTQGYAGSQAYARALSEPSPASSSGPSVFAGLYSTSRGFIRDDRGPHDAQLAIGGQQLLPGKSGPKPSIEQAKKRAVQLANEVDRETGASKKVNQVANQANKANVPQDADQAKKQADQMKNIVREEFQDAEEAAEDQRRREAGDEGWKSNVFDL